MNSPLRRGEVVRVRLDPVEGSEETGECHALVISPDLINEHSPVIIVAVITSKNTDRVYPFEALIEPPDGDGEATTASDTADLWRRHKRDADPGAREALIRQYAHLVKIVAGRVVTSLPPNIERDDLVSAGVVGLIKAVDQFDTSLQVRFETYAIVLIREAILEMLRENDWVPRSVRERVKWLEGTYVRLEMVLDRPASGEEKVCLMQIRSIDKRRVIGRYGAVSDGTMQSVEKALKIATGLYTL